MTKEQFVTPSRGKKPALLPRFSFPRNNRLLRRKDFLKVYQDGIRVPGPYFSAFCLAGHESDEFRIGFTVPRAIGNAVARNRVKRRMREAVRLRLPRSGRGWWIVFNPRRLVLKAPFPDLLKDVEKVFRRCMEQNTA